MLESSENDCNDLSLRVLQIAARDKSEATDALIKGFNDLRSKLLRETQSVNKAVEESDVKFLETLALEKQKDRS